MREGRFTHYLITRQMLKHVGANKVAIQTKLIYKPVSRLTVVSREAKEEVPCEGLSTNAREYFTRTNLVKIKNAITGEPSTLALYNSR